MHRNPAWEASVARNKATGYFNPDRYIEFGRHYSVTERVFEEQRGMVPIKGLSLGRWAHDVVRDALLERNMCLGPWTALCLRGQGDQTLYFSSAADAVLARILIDD
jgi:hypothetical protein